MNPAHLFLGTHLDNMRDMAEKGRSRAPQGEKHHIAKLAEEQVLDIRSRDYSVRGSVVVVAKEFGVCHQLISQIRNRSCWKHI